MYFTPYFVIYKIIEFYKIKRLFIQNKNNPWLTQTIMQVKQLTLYK